MKTIKLITIICAVTLLSVACRRDITPEQTLSATFIIDTPATKAMGTGTLATELSVRVFDANHTFMYEQKATRGETGWKIELKLVPATYTFSFFAFNDKADAFTFEDEYMTLSYPLMDMNADTEDAFWASIADIDMTSSFERTVTLRRPFATLMLATDLFWNEPLEGASSSFTITGAMPTRLNLITGETDMAVRKAIYTASPISDYTIGRHTVAGYAFVLIGEDGLTVPEVGYKITLGDGRLIEGSAREIPLERNYRTVMKDY